MSTRDRPVGNHPAPGTTGGRGLRDRPGAPWLAAGADIEVILGYVAIIGPGAGASEAQIADARSAGRRLAERGHVIVNGGLGGVMGGAAAGAAEAGGIAVGLLPGDDRGAGHPANSVLIATGLGELRNGLILRAADAVLAIGGSWGTLSELAMAVRTGLPTIVVRGWHLPEPGTEPFDDVDSAVERVLTLLEGTAPGRRVGPERDR